MQRKTLMKIVAKAADKADLPSDRKQELLLAVSDPDVKVVGWGRFGDGSPKAPFCPSALANIKFGYDNYDQFWQYFDDALWRRPTTKVAGAFKRHRIKVRD